MAGEHGWRRDLWQRRRSHFDHPELHDGFVAKWEPVSRGVYELGRDGHHHGGHADRKLPDTADDHHAAGEPDGVRGPDGDFHGRGDGLANTHGAMAGEHGCRRDLWQRRRSHFDHPELHDGFVAKWEPVSRVVYELGRDGHHHGGHADGEQLLRTASDHDPAGQSDGDRGPDGDFHGRGDGLANTHGAMAGEHGWRRDVQQRRRSHFHHSELHDGFVAKWEPVSRGVYELGRDGHHHGGHADGEQLLHTANDHDPAGQSDGDRGPDGDFHGRGDGLANTHGAMAGEHGWRRNVQQRLRSHFDHPELHDGLGAEREPVSRGVYERGRDGHHHGGHTDRECDSFRHRRAPEHQQQSLH